MNLLPRIVVEFNTEEIIDGLHPWKAFFEGHRQEGDIEGVGRSPEEAIGYLMRSPKSPFEIEHRIAPKPEPK